jgi:hypothetical protein
MLSDPNASALAIEEGTITHRPITVGLPNASALGMLDGKIV